MKRKACPVSGRRMVEIGRTFIAEMSCYRRKGLKVELFDPALDCFPVDAENARRMRSIAL